MQTIIDAHFHIWDFDYFSLDWIKEERLKKNFSFEDYSAEYSSVDFWGGVYIEVDSSNKRAENIYIKNLFRQKDQILTIIQGLDSKEKIKFGFRVNLNKKDIDEALINDIKSIKAPIFEVCTGVENILKVKKLAEANFNKKIIINHFFNIDLNEKISKKYINNLERLAKLENVYFKLSPSDNWDSSISINRYKELISLALNLFGETRVMFGSNYPVSKFSPLEWMEIIKEGLKEFKGTSKDELKSLKNKVFFKNALKIYNIKPKRIKRFGQIIKIKPEKLQEYKNLHANAWAGVCDKLKKCNIKNYNIYYFGEYLFAYFEYVGKNYKKDMKKITKDKATIKWWLKTDPCQIPLQEGKNWADMEAVFHLD